MGQTSGAECTPDDEQPHIRHNQTDVSLVSYPKTKASFLPRYGYPEHGSVYDRFSKVKAFFSRFFFQLSDQKLIRRPELSEAQLLLCTSILLKMFI